MSILVNGINLGNSNYGTSTSFRGVEDSVVAFGKQMVVESKGLSINPYAQEIQADRLKAYQKTLGEGHPANIAEDVANCLAKSYIALRTSGSTQEISCVYASMFAQKLIVEHRPEKEAHYLAQEYTKLYQSHKEAGRSVKYAEAYAGSYFHLSIQGAAQKEADAYAQCYAEAVEQGIARGQNRIPDYAAAYANVRLVDKLNDAVAKCFAHHYVKALEQNKTHREAQLVASGYTEAQNWNITGDAAELFVQKYINGLAKLPHDTALKEAYDFIQFYQKGRSEKGMNPANAEIFAEERSLGHSEAFAEMCAKVTEACLSKDETRDSARHLAREYANTYARYTFSAAKARIHVAAFVEALSENGLVLNDALSYANAYMSIYSKSPLKRDDPSSAATIAKLFSSAYVKGLSKGFIHEQANIYAHTFAKSVYQERLSHSEAETIAANTTAAYIQMRQTHAPGFSWDYAFLHSKALAQAKTWDQAQDFARSAADVYHMALNLGVSATEAFALAINPEEGF